MNQRLEIAVTSFSVALVGTFLRYAWALPVGFVGMPGALLIFASGGKARLHEGVCEASGGWAGKLPGIRLPFAGSVSAITFGHIVLAACEQSLLTTQTHERAHVHQYERWGLLFFPAYALAGFALG